MQARGVPVALNGTQGNAGVFPGEALNKSILDFSAPVIGKAWFSDDSQNQWLTASDVGSTSLRCGKH